MWVRISAAIAAIVLGVFLGIVAVRSFGPGAVVVPTGGVTGGGPQDDLPYGAQASRELSQRTQLQRWRGETGPEPGKPAEALITGDPRAPEDAARGDSAAKVSEWTAGADRNWTLLRPPAFHEGTLNLPKARSAVLVQPDGRDWRRLHNEELTYAGGWIIFGVALALAFFLLIRGRIPLEIGFSGRTVLRFPPFERANHWMTAVSFIVMALTGLMILYGRYLVKPWTGADIYGDVAAASVYLHIAFAAPFTLGIVIMAIMWLRQNLPERADFQWLAKFGGFLNSRAVKPPARRFNAGQKLIFWGVVLGGLLLFASGLGLMFPFLWTNIEGMQWTMMVHTGLALLMVALIIGHIYIGTIGMVGAFDAMWSGEVDRNWAEEHHRLWLAELEGRSPEEIARETERKADRDQEMAHRREPRPRRRQEA